MLSNGFATPIRIERIPSRLHYFLLVLLHLLALTADLVSNLPIYWMIAIALLLSLNLGYQLWKSRQSCKSVWISQATGNWFTSEDDFRYAWHIYSVRSLTRLFMVLQLQSHVNRRANLVIFRDQISSDDYRRLFVRLRFSQVVAASPGDTIS